MTDMQHKIRPKVCDPQRLNSGLKFHTDPNRINDTSLEYNNPLRYNNNPLKYLGHLGEINNKRLEKFKPDSEGSMGAKANGVSVPEMPMAERLELVKPGQTVREFYEDLVREMVARCADIPPRFRSAVIKNVLEDTSSRSPAEKIEAKADKWLLMQRMIDEIGQNVTKDPGRFLISQRERTETR